MRQLTSLDAQFLALETNRQAGHVGGLAILDPSTRPTAGIDCADIKALLTVAYEIEYGVPMASAPRRSDVERKSAIAAQKKI